MYRYDDIDQGFVDERVAEFRDQTQRFLAGQLTEEEFRPLRLRNGLYIQRHAPMLRIAVPYGLLSTRQLRMLAHVARRYDRAYGHFTTRQNIQLNWPKLETVPDILADLATVEMHAIQTSGNCIRNVTADHLAGVAADELQDPRPYCEIIRQWSTLHPEFSYLPRKFKIAVTGSPTDRAASEVHDVGLHIRRDAQGHLGFEVLVGGGLGRAPAIGQVVREFLPEVEADWLATRAYAPQLTREQIEHMRSFFAPPPYEQLSDVDAAAGRDAQFRAWYRYNTVPHKIPGYRAVFISLKAHGTPPGDISSEQMEAVADLADRVSFGLVRTTHNQNLLLADVRQIDLFEVWQELARLNLATPNIGTLTDMIACPGLDFC